MQQPLLRYRLFFLSGDEGICEEAKELNGNIQTVAVNKGIGNSVISIHPDLAVEKTNEGIKLALTSDLEQCKIDLPKHFKMELSFKKHWKAYKASFYPGMQKLPSTNILFESDDYFDVLRMLMFST